MASSLLSDWLAPLLAMPLVGRRASSRAESLTAALRALNPASIFAFCVAFFISVAFFLFAFVFRCALHYFLFAKVKLFFVKKLFIRKIIKAVLQRRLSLSSRLSRCQMTSPGRPTSLHYVLYHYWDETGDPRTAHYPLMANGPWTMLSLMATYLLFVNKLGPQMMKNRPAFDLRWPMFAYNVTLVALNAYFFVEASFISIYQITQHQYLILKLINKISNICKNNNN